MTIDICEYIYIYMLLFLKRFVYDFIQNTYLHNIYYHHRINIRCSFTMTTIGVTANYYFYTIVSERTKSNCTYIVNRSFVFLATLSFCTLKCKAYILFHYCLFRDHNWVFVNVMLSRISKVLTNFSSKRKDWTEY